LFVERKFGMAPEIWALIISNIVTIVTVIATQWASVHQASVRQKYQYELEKQKDEAERKRVRREYLERQYERLVLARKEMMKADAVYSAYDASDATTEYAEALSDAVSACLACGDDVLNGLIVGEPGFTYPYQGNVSPKKVHDGNMEIVEKAMRRLADLMVKYSE